MRINIQLPFAKQRKQLKDYFHRPILIYSTTYEPGVLVKDFTDKKGDKYCRVVFANRVKVKGHYPMTDIPARHIIKAAKHTSLFMRTLIKYKILRKNYNDESSTK